MQRYFNLYAIGSLGWVFVIVFKSMQQHTGLFDIIVELTGSKFNLIAFLNCITALLMMFGKCIIYVFFNEIKEVESKHLVDKTQKKVF